MTGNQDRNRINITIFNRVVNKITGGLLPARQTIITLETVVDRKGVQRRGPALMRVVVGREDGGTRYSHGVGREIVLVPAAILAVELIEDARVVDV